VVVVKLMVAFRFAGAPEPSEHPVAVPSQLPDTQSKSRMQISTLESLVVAVNS
jgi:hypothetical protein